MERRLATALHRFFARQLDRVLRTLERIQPRLVEEQRRRRDIRPLQEKAGFDLPIDWNAEELALSATVDPLIAEIVGNALDNEQRRWLALGIRTSWEIWDQAAAEMARRYQFDLIRDLTESTRRQLGQAIAEWIESEDAFPALVKRVRRILPARKPPGLVRDRAQLIAITEVTRIYADSRVAGMRAVGLRRMRWRTAEDELVCPICAPLGQADNGQGMVGTIESGFQHPTNGMKYLRPPAHPGCRCWIVEDTEELSELLGGVEESEWLGKPPEGFTSTDDATEWMHAHYPHIHTNFEGSDVRVVEEMVPEFHRLAQEYPYVAEKITFLGIAEAPSTLSNAYAWADGQTFSISFNPRFARDYQTFMRSLKEDEEIGFHPAGTGSIAGVMAHEFGHLLNRYLITSTKAFSPVVRPDGLGLVSDAKRQFVQAVKATRRLSEYALYNEREAWAEAFTSSRFTPRRRWTRYVRALEKLLQATADPARWRDEWRWTTDLSSEEREALQDQLENLIRFAREVGIW
ncbi:MAG TPA: hypothetical protein G4O02_13405 [Caldilineae bacterium]|nr:hypothetical protein [Caldilineae bacterium]